MSTTAVHRINLDNPLSDNSSVSQTELPFTFQQVKAAIPSECFVPNVWRSLAYFFADAAIIAGLYAAAVAIDSWWFYPIFWFATGTMFWAFFVVGHDCGHGSFSRSKWLNNLIGHLTHIPILVPYHGWRISYCIHYQNTGNIDTDESWYPVTESEYKAMDWIGKLIRFDALLFAYPFYLFKRSPARTTASHFFPNNDLFRESETNDVVTSSVCWLVMFTFLGWLGFTYGFMFLFKFYIVPYLIFVVWLDLVTYLHHTEADIPWYRGKDWYFFKGALSTIDRDYGIFNDIHHNIGTHVAHHLFIGIPHYYLKTATEAIKPVLGDYYRVSSEPIWKSFFTSQKACQVVPDEGTTVYYHNQV